MQNVLCNFGKEHNIMEKNIINPPVGTGSLAVYSDNYLEELMKTLAPCSTGTGNLLVDTVAFNTATAQHGSDFMVGFVCLLLQKGYRLVFTDVFYDVHIVLMNLAWFRELLEADLVEIHRWFPKIEAQFQRGIALSGQTNELNDGAIRCITVKGDTIDEAVQNSDLPLGQEMLEAIKMVCKYGKVKSEEEAPNTWVPNNEFFPASDHLVHALAELNLDVYKCTRSDVLSACKAADCMDLFAEYNAWYQRKFWNQHRCIGAALPIDISDIVNKSLLAPVFIDNAV